MSNTADPAVQNCEAALTPDDPDTIIVNPPAEPARRPEAALRRREVLAQHGWFDPACPGVGHEFRFNDEEERLWVATRSSSTRNPASSSWRITTSRSSRCRPTCAKAKGLSQKAAHGVILRNVATNICGSDQHMVRGRTTAPPGQTLGHEITGEIVEKGEDVQFLEVGDICSVPFNIACGRCRNCREGQTGVCLNVNPARAGSAYGYVDMGGWEGGQAEYVMVPFADFNLLKFPDRDQALEKILDLTMLSDIFPTGYHGAFSAGVTTGSTVYVAGAGPVGLAAAYSSQLLGAAVVIVGDLNEDRLAQARSFGCETVDITQDATLEDQIAEILGTNEVDCAVDAVGFEASGHGRARARPRPPCSTRSWP